MIEVAASDPPPSNEGWGAAGAWARDPGQATTVEPLGGCGGGAVGATGAGSGAGTTVGAGAASQVEGGAVAAGSWSQVEPGGPAGGSSHVPAAAAAGSSCHAGAPGGGSGTGASPQVGSAGAGSGGGAGSDGAAAPGYSTCIVASSGGGCGSTGRVVTTCVSATGSGSAAITGSGGASGTANSGVSIATVSATGSGSGSSAGSGSGAGAGVSATTTGSGSAASSAVGAGSSKGSGSISTAAWATGSGSGSGAGCSSTAGAGGTVATTPAERSVVCVPRNRSNQPTIRRRRSTLRSGRPLRDMSCDSSGNLTSSAVWPSKRRAPNSSSDCEIAQRRSISPQVSSSGVFISRTYLIGERSHSASWSGHGAGPSSSSPHSTMSCCAYSLTRFEIERMDTAAENRFVWPMAQLVMKPPYDPPPIPMRAVSTAPVRSITWSSAVIRSR